MKLILTLLALALCSCSDMFVDEGKARPNNENLPDLTAAFVEETETRTYVENNKHLRWHEDDRITAFYGNTLNRQYKFNGLTGDNSGTFSLVPDGMLGTGNTFDHVYAIYPYNADARISDEGVISLTLPAMQTYAENSFGDGANTMIAVTENLEDTFLVFKNVCGYLKLKLYDPDGGGLKSVTIKGNNNEKIAGAATATVKFGEAPVITMTDEATNSVTLDCGEGILLGTTVETATELWIVLPETIFTKGITIIATDVDGGIFEKSTSKEVIIERNTIQPMVAVEMEYEVLVPETWKIYYTATKRITLYERYYDKGFGVNYVYDKWNEATGEGVIVFDGEITSIGEWAFFREYDLISMVIPDSVTLIGDNAFSESNIESIYMPNSVTEIEDSAFSACRCIKDITLPENITKIGDRAFEDCANLTSITIPESVVSIGTSAFSGCTNLTAFYGKYASEDNRCLIEDELADIGKIYLSAFAPKGITEYIIPNGVTIIDDEAFHDADELECVVIADSVTVIEDKAFSDCDSLKSVVIGSGVTTIYGYPFSYCRSLECICLKSTTPPYGGDSIFYEYDYPDCQCTLYVPIESIDDYKADSYWSETIANINIEGSHFAATSEIHYTTNDGNIVESIGELFGAKIISNTYQDDKGVIKLLGYVMKLGDTFINCSNLTSITLPSSVTSLESDAFKNCLNLTSVIIPECVNFVDFCTFDNCKNLKQIYFKSQNPPVLYHPAFFYYSETTPWIYVPYNSVSAYKNAENWTYWTDLIVGYSF